jgi:hypothetical protein
VLRAIATVTRSSTDDAAIRRALGGITDWPALLDAGDAQRLTAFLAEHLTAVARDLVPQDVLRDLAERQALIAANALGTLRETSLVIRTLQANGVRALAFKGPALSHLVYGDAGKRACVDLDVVIRPADRARAIIVLRDLGYALAGDVTMSEARVIYAGLGQLPMRRRDEGNEWRLDLHWRFTTDHLRWTLPVEDVIARSIAVTIGAVGLPFPSAEDALLLQLLRSARHGFDSLEALLVVRTQFAQQTVDARLLLDRATSVGGRRAFLVGCGLAQRLLDADLPEPIRSAMVADPAVARLVDGLVGDLEAGRVPLRVHPIVLGLLERPSDRWRYRFLALLLPTPLEREWCPLPAPLAPLYWLVRPVRLLWVRLTR